MNAKHTTIKNAVLVTLLVSVTGAAGSSFSPESFARAQDAAQPAVARRIGVVKAINGNSLTVAPASGPEVAVTVQPTARILQLAPGDKDLKNATSIQLQELKVGDTVRVRGTASDDGKSMSALEVLLITASAVGAIRDQLSQDWQKRGISGPVSAVDPSTGTVTIAISSFAGKKTIAVHTSKSTIVRRYAADSPKFEDAKLSTLADVQVGDQLRARGDRNADGSELTAEEIVAGSFPNFAGLIKSVDATAGTISLQDVVSKKTVELKVTADSQLHKIPAEIAQRFAMRLKSSMPPGTPGAAASTSGQPAPSAGQGAGATPGTPPGNTPGAASGAAPGGAPGAGRAGGGFDFQRLLDQTPAVTLTDLHKGDAIAVLGTQGTPAGGSTVIKLFSGVEPILQAAPNGSQAMMLAPWSLGGAPGGDAGP